MSNTVLKRIHQVLGNLVRTINISTQTYVDENYPWKGILAALLFATCSTNNRLKGYSPGQLIFGCDMILAIKHMVDWGLIHQHNQMQINIDNTLENKYRVNHDYKVGDKFMLIYHTAYKYETPYKIPFVITQCLTNGTVNLQCGAIKIKYNICRIKPYKSGTKLKDYNSINMYDAVNI